MRRSHQADSGANEEYMCEISMPTAANASRTQSGGLVVSWVLSSTASCTGFANASILTEPWSFRSTQPECPLSISSSVNNCKKYRELPVPVIVYRFLQMYRAGNCPTPLEASLLGGRTWRGNMFRRKSQTKLLNFPCLMLSRALAKRLWI